MAIKQAKCYVEEGYTHVVDIDLAKFFDRVNHDRLMAAVAARVADRRMLRLIRSFLTAGVLDNGLFEASEEGTPQGDCSRTSCWMNWTASSSDAATGSCATRMTVRHDGAKRRF